MHYHCNDSNVIDGGKWSSQYGSFPHDIPLAHMVKQTNKQKKKHDGVSSNKDGFLIESVFNNDALWQTVECWHGQILCMTKWLHNNNWTEPTDMINKRMVHNRVEISTWVFDVFAI